MSSQLAIRPLTRTESDLVQKHYPLCQHIAKRWTKANPGLSTLDLAHDGVLGLIYAVKRYPDLDEYNFPKRAAMCIENYIRTAVFKQWKTVTIPMHAVQRHREFMQSGKTLSEYTAGMRKNQKETFIGVCNAMRLNRYKQLSRGFDPFG